MMTRLHAIAAAATLVAVGSAQALTPTQIDAARAAGTLKETRVAGASALRLSIAAYMKEICTASSFHVIWNSNAEGTNHRAYSCNLAVAQGNYAIGTPVLVYKRDQGGSGQGVNPIALAADQTHMRVLDDATCTPINGGATPSTDAAIPNFICTGTETTGIKSDAGISDVEPALFQATQNLPGTAALTGAQLASLDVSPLVQALFGVVVNKKAYRALQEAQGIIAPGASLVDVPADQALWNDATLATIPSLPATFVRAALTGALTGGAANANLSTGLRGWNIVIPTTVDANSVTKTINICRRTEGSGTQAVSNAFFANNPCGGTSSQLTPLGVSGSAGNVSPSLNRVTGAPISVQEGTSAGQVEACVGNNMEAAADGDGIGYALALLGREANPKRGAAGADLGYRYVKLDGVAPVRSQARVGNYGLVYEATMQWNTTTVPAGSDKARFLAALRTGFGTPNALAAVDSDTQQGVMTPPAAYTGPFASASGNTALFGSRVARLTGNSCGPLRMIK